METKPKPFVFVLMPFGEEFSEIYKLGIKTACQNAGAYCERVDEQIFVESILARIYNQIAKADIVVSDMTNRNPNVFYETGYAHALNKQVILLTQRADDIPFDLKHYPHIVYGGKIIPLLEQLESKIRWCVENPQSSLTTAEVNIQLSINRVSVEDNPKIAVESTETIYGQQFALIIGIHNLSPKVVNPQTFSLALVLPNIIDVIGSDIVSLPTWMSDEQQILNLKQTDTLFPDGWCSMYLACRIQNHKIKSQSKNLSFTASLRLFTELGPRDFPFTIKAEFKKSG